MKIHIENMCFMVYKYKNNNKENYYISDNHLCAYKKQDVIMLKKICENHLKLKDSEIDKMRELSQQMFLEELNKININKSDKKKQGYIYILKSKLGYKVGRSKTKDRPNKLTGIILPIKVSIYLCIEVSDYIKAEKEIHEQYSELLIRGEWFKLSKEDLENIENYLKLWWVL